MRSRPTFARPLAAVLSFLAAVLPTVAAPHAAAGPLQPSIVVINTDDQRFDALAACLPAPGLGRPGPLSTCPMPNVRDDLIAHGVTFAQSFVTTALCCPSRASLFTGNYARTTGVLTNEKPRGGFSAFRGLQGSTIATWLHAAGYRTGLFGKYLNQYAACATPPCSVPPGWDAWHAEVTDGDVDYTNFELNDDGAINAYPAPQYSTTVLGEKAARFISTASDDDPLFVYFAPFAPHPPALPAADDEHAFDSMPAWRPPSWDTVEADKPQWVRDTPDLGPTAISNKDAEDRDEMASLLEVDRQVGAIVDALGPRAAHTLFIFTSDNGISWGEHRYFNKKNCEYEECHRVPLVVRYDPLTDPAGSGPGRVDGTHPVLNEDVAPTLAEAAGLMGTGAMDGRSFLPLLSAAAGDDPADWRTELPGEDYGSLIQTGVPVPTLSLVRTFPGDPLPGSGGHAWKYVELCAQSDTNVPCTVVEHELYDETTDPYERDNRAGDPSLASLEAELAARLAANRSTVPPSVTFPSGPPSVTNRTSWDVAFHAPGTTRSWCSLDGGQRTACTSPVSTGVLGEGSHTLTVVADGTDVTAGAAGTSAPASRTWIVDTTAPDTVITAGPSGTTPATATSFTFTSSEPGSSYACSLDGGPFAACASPRDLSGLGQGSHAFSVRAVDAAGNVDSSPAARSWTVDSVPETTITAGPADGSLLAATGTTFRFSADIAGSTFRCSLDGATFGACTTPLDLSGLGQGPHTFRVRAANSGFTDPTPAARSFTVDTVTPETSITDGPSGPVGSTGPYDVAFASSESGSSFVCRVDGSPWTSCTSPRTVTVAGEGPHSFSVRATDPAGNHDPTPASRSWSVDVTPPDTTIDSGPSGTVASTAAQFTFSSSETGGSFICSRDGAAPEDCESPRGYGSLDEGAHTFAVQAVDRAGNVDGSKATRTWTVDTLPPPDPTLTDVPPDPGGSSASFAFTDAEPGVTFSCRIDGSVEEPCTSPVSYADLVVGLHTFEVTAADTVGNVSAPVSHDWEVRPPPSVESLDGPPEATNETTVSFTFTATDPEATFTCALDSGEPGPCTSPWSVTVGDGPHSFSVVATDSIGSSDPRAVTWRTDTVPPAVALTAPAAEALLTGTTATVRWTWTDADPSSGHPAFVLEERVAPDPGYVPVGSTSSKSLVRSGLAEGTTACWRVVATDPAGNAATSPERCAGVPLDDRALASSGPLGMASSAAAFDGTLTMLNGPEASMTHSFEGARVGVMLERGPGLGKARVILDGEPRKDLDLYAPSPQHRRYLWTRAFSTSGAHTVGVLYLGTRNSASTGTDVPIDAVTVVGSTDAPASPVGRFRW